VVSSQLDLTTVFLDRGSRESLSGQVAAALEARIATGLLASGDRLPTTRQLSAALAINRGTVQAAYRRLQEAGLVESRVGSGTVVRAAPAPEQAFDLDRLLSQRTRSLIREPDSPTWVPSVADFSRLTTSRARCFRPGASAATSGSTPPLLASKSCAAKSPEGSRPTD
jgi:DNA-binding transcriptional regulator YhcF (GntR family)